MRRKRTAAQLVQRALGCQGERRLGSCWAAWRSEAAHIARSRQLLAQALGRLSQRHLALAFGEWREAAGLRRRRRVLVAGAVAKLGGERLRECFRVWRQWGCYKRQLASAEAAARTARRRRQVATCVAAWRAAAHRQSIARRCLAAICLRLARSAFTAWLAATEDARASAAAAALAPKLVRRCFAQWRAVLLLAGQKRQRVEQAAAWAFGSSRQRPWRAWRLFLSRKRQKHAAVQRFRAGVLRRSLLAWQERVLRKQRLVVKQQHLQQQAAARLLGGVLLKWRRAVKARSFLRRYFCSPAWATWAEHASAAKVRAGATALAGLHRSTGEGAASVLDLRSTACLLAFPPGMQAKREALRHAVNLLSHGAAARCFDAWRSLAAARALKQAAFERKQAAVREALAIGDAIIRQKRWVGQELLTCH